MIHTCTALGLVSLSTLTVACLGPDLGFAGSGGGASTAGIGGGATTSGAGGDSSTSGDGGGGATTSGGGGGGDVATSSTATGAGGGCTSPDECPDPGDPCLVATCEASACGFAPGPEGTACDLAVDLVGVCDVLGSCVQCIADDGCGPAETCDEVAGVCVLACENGELDGDETDVDCGGTCEANCAAGLDCLLGTDCESNVCGPNGDCAAGTVVFVSAADLRPDFGGALAGDALCQQFADAAGLSGTFMAWLSDSTTSPSVRFDQSAEPYLRIDGVVVASNWAGLTSGVIQAGITIDEAGGVNPSAEVWTGTSPSGTLFGETCLDWTTQDGELTGYAGITANFDERWTVVYSQFCNRIGLRLYCFQQ